MSTVSQETQYLDDYSTPIIIEHNERDLDSTLIQILPPRQEKKEEEKADPDVTWYDKPETVDKDFSETATESVVVPIEQISVQCLISMLASEECETGISNPSESFFVGLLKNDRISALNVLSTVFMNCFSLEPKKITVLVGTLHLISHLDYNQVYPTGQTLAIAAISHNNAEVAEYGIKCFENWKHPDGAAKLKAIRFPTKWLQEYADDVIAEISEGE